MALPASEVPDVSAAHACEVSLKVRRVASWPSSVFASRIGIPNPEHLEQPPSALMSHRVRSAARATLIAAATAGCVRRRLADSRVAAQQPSELEKHARADRIVTVALNGYSTRTFDISETGMAVARKSAEAAGVKITTINSTMEAFDYGAER